MPEKKEKGARSFLKIYSIASNFAVTLVSPVILLLLLYQYIEKKIGYQPVILIVFIITGIITGYYSFYKLLKNTMKKK